MTIKIGAGVRDNVTRRLGKVRPKPHGTPREHISVQWDGRGIATVAIRDVTLVSPRYETAKAWETGWVNKDPPEGDCRQERFWVTNP